MRCQLNLRTFVSAEDVESELEAVDAYCLVLFDTTDAKTIELIEDETDVILIENKNATEEENKEQNAQKEEKEEVEEVHEIARITNIEAVPQRRHKPFIIYECINL